MHANASSKIDPFVKNGSLHPQKGKAKAGHLICCLFLDK
jgi:hypothetical protein